MGITRRRATSSRVRLSVWLPDEWLDALRLAGGDRPGEWVRNVVACELARLGCRLPDIVGINHRTGPGRPRMHVCTPAALAASRRRVAQLTSEISALMASGHDPARQTIVRKRQALERARLRRDYLKRGVRRRRAALRDTGRPLSNSRRQREKQIRLGAQSACVVVRVDLVTGSVWTADTKDEPDGAGYLTRTGSWVSVSRWHDANHVRKALTTYLATTGAPTGPIPIWLTRFLGTQLT